MCLSVNGLRLTSRMFVVTSFEVAEVCCCQRVVSVFRLVADARDRLVNLWPRVQLMSSANYEPTKRVAGFARLGCSICMLGWPLAFG